MVDRFLEIDKKAWSGLEETAGSSSPKHHVGAVSFLISIEFMLKPLENLLISGIKL